MIGLGNFGYFKIGNNNILIFYFKFWIVCIIISFFYCMFRKVIDILFKFGWGGRGGGGFGWISLIFVYFIL